MLAAIKKTGALQVLGVPKRDIITNLRWSFGVPLRSTSVKGIGTK